MELNKNERIDDLQIGGLKIIQNKTKYCFTSDSAILSNFVKTKKTDNVCEIGTGTGIISILVSYKQNPKKITAFEIQNEIASLAKRNVELNNLQDRIEIINAPIQNCFSFVKQESFNVVMANPPYRKIDEKTLVSISEEKAISKHELKLNLNELVLYAKKLLCFGGKFYIVYDANRTAELIYKLKENKLEPKKMFFTAPSQNSKPILVLIEAVKGGKPSVEIMETVYNVKGENHG